MYIEYNTAGMYTYLLELHECFLFVMGSHFDQVNSQFVVRLSAQQSVDY